MAVRFSRAAHRASRTSALVIEPPPGPPLHTFTPPTPTAPSSLRLLQKPGTVNQVLVSFQWGEWADYDHDTPHLMSYRINGGAYTSDVLVEPLDDITISGGVATDVVDIRVKAVNDTGSSSYRTAQITLGAAGTTRYLAPTAQGTGAGTSAADAAAFSASAVSTAITAAGANGKVVFLTDYGPYTLYNSTLSTSGSSQHPVMLVGQTAAGVEAYATFVGDRTVIELPDDEDEVTDCEAIEGFVTGSIGFRPNGSHLWFRKLRFEHVGSPFYPQAGTRSDHVIDDIQFHNTSRGYFTGDDTAIITGVHIRNVTADGFGKQVIRLNGTSGSPGQYVIRDCDLNSHWIDNDSGGFPAGVATDVGAIVDGITCLRVAARNQHFTLSNNTAAYWNGDGFAFERANNNIFLVACSNRGSTDGGVDSKAPGLRLYNCDMEDNKRNYRCWGDDGDIDMWKCISTNPRKRGGTGGAAHITLSAWADVWVRDMTFNDTGNNTTFLALDSTGSVLRWTNITLNTPTGNVIRAFESVTDQSLYHPNVDPDQTNATLGFTTAADHSLDEDETLVLPIEVTGTGNLFLRNFPDQNGDTSLAFLGGAITNNAQATDYRLELVNPDYEVPLDSSTFGGEAAADNQYIKILRVRDEARNEASRTFRVQVGNIPGDNTGEVTEGSTFYWRFNNVDKTTGRLSLSGSENKTATRNSTLAPGNATVKGTMPFWAPLHSTGYFEAEFGTIGDSSGVGIGFCNSSHAVGTPDTSTTNGSAGSYPVIGLGSNYHSIVWKPNGQVVMGNTVIATVASYSAGQRLRIAVKENGVTGFWLTAMPTYRYLWLAVENGNWNNSASANPATGAGGIQFGDDGFADPSAQGTPLTTAFQGVVDPLYPAAQLYDQGDAVTVYSDPDEWDFSAPSGYSAWGSVRQYNITGNSTRFVNGSNVASGTGSGDSWANAAQLSNLNLMIGAAGAGGYVMVDADTAMVNWTTVLSLSTGGAEDDPVTVVGVTRTTNIPHPLTLYGTRTGWLMPDNPETRTDGRASTLSNGLEFLKHNAGANHIKWKFWD